MQFKEVETKYRVSALKLQAFTDLATSLSPVKFIEAAGYDYYYVKDTTDFIRYRAGSLHELTVKKKLADKNNFIRTEINMGVKEQSLEIIEAFCASLGYKFNFSIFKTCFIYYYEHFDLVYYVVYDNNMKELDRFVEIEMLETYEWESPEAAWAKLLEIEQLMKPLGITPQSRIKKSLFEMLQKA